MNRLAVERAAGSSPGHGLSAALLRALGTETDCARPREVVCVSIVGRSEHGRGKLVRSGGRPAGWLWGKGGVFFFSTAKSAPNSHDASFLVCAGVLGRSITNLETKGLATISFRSTSFSTETLKYESG